MSYHLQAAESVENGIKRIALDQIERALAEARGEGVEPDAAAHQCRKRCKKLRGLVRLVRPAFDRYEKENERFRDAARGLSTLRDHESMIEAYDALMKRYGEEVDRHAMGRIRRRLTLDLQDLREQSAEGRGERFEAFIAAMEQAGARVEKWKLNEDGFDAIEDGLIKTYDRARKAHKRARKDPTPGRLHELRKRVKYHWYHWRLLNEVWPEGFKGSRREASRLSDLLGEAHDLHLFREHLRQRTDHFADHDSLEVLLALSKRRVGELAEEALHLGGRLLAEKPDALVRRVGVNWRLWKERASAHA